MSLAQTLILVLLAVLIRLLFPNKGRFWVILAVSVLAVYWLQPVLPIRGLDFWFPTASLGLVLLSWGLTADRNALKDRESQITAGFVLTIIILISLTRFISLETILTASRPPQFFLILIALGLVIGTSFLFITLEKPAKTISILGIALVLGILLILKNPLLSTQASIGLRSLLAQSPALAHKTDLGWLGFSYLSFRIIHTLIDRYHGRLNDIRLGEFFVYTIFFPAFLAGPIDRLQNFRKFNNHFEPLVPTEACKHLVRLLRGLFRKFVIADTLAFFALNAINVNQVSDSHWLWIMVISYSLQLYFDFAGYTDIAIAAGGFLGFELPENFNRPYLQPNLTQFWNNWHISLTQWFRAYFFNPFTRFLRMNKKIPTIFIILITQMSTMVIIGLWHGVTLNYLIWGFWHGFGLFIHNQWSKSFGKQLKMFSERRPVVNTLISVSNVLLTFTFTSIGWIWFVLPSTEQSWQTLLRLFGVG